MESVPPNFGRMAYAIRSCSDANLLSWPAANTNSAFIVCCIALLAKDMAASLLVLIDAMVGTTLTALYQQSTSSPHKTSTFVFLSFCDQTSVSFDYLRLSTTSKSVPDIMLTVSDTKNGSWRPVVGVLPFLQNQLAQTFSSN